MSAPQRDLHAVPLPPDEGTPLGAGSSPWWAWIAAVGFVLCAAGWYTAQQGAAELQARLEATQAELAGAQAELRAHQSHPAQGRGRSDPPASDLQALALEAERLAEDVARDPRAPASGDDGGAPAAAAH